MASRKNVLLIVVDQERRWGDLPQGFPFNESLPVRAALRNESVEFRNFHVCSIPCGPARGTLYTGTHFQTHGLYANDFTLPPDLPTIGTMLRDAGYATAYKGKWHMDWGLYARPETEGRPPRVAGQDGGYESRWDALEQFGFSDWNDDGDFWGAPLEGFELDGRFAKEAADWIHDKGARISAKSQPWFLAVNFINPHDIMFFRASEEHDASRDKNLLPPVPFLSAPSSDIYSQKWGCRPRSPEDCSSQVPPIVADSRIFFDRRYGKFTSMSEYEANTDYYINCLCDVDKHIGSVLAALSSAGLAENTIVVYTSDHGEMLGDHGLRQKGAFLYKENIGVPLLIRAPGVEPGICDVAASGLDIVPTVLGLAGIRDWAKAYPWLHGVDLSPCLVGRSFHSIRDVSDPDLNGATLFQFGDFRAVLKPEAGRRKPRGFLQGIVTHRYKFGRCFDADHSLPLSWYDIQNNFDILLYDRVHDAEETCNLASDVASMQRHRDLIIKLNAHLNQLILVEAQGGKGPWSKQIASIQAAGAFKSSDAKKLRIVK